VKNDYGKYFGSAMMVGFGVLALYRWHQTQLVFFLLLVLRDFAAGYFFFKRKPAQTKGKLIPSLLAYVSSAMPLLYFGPNVDTKLLFLASDLLAILGFLVVAFATVELGTSIGISPANRGHVRSGIYRYIKHPMYLGYIVSEFGLIFLNSANILIWMISFGLYVLRMKLEKKVFN
jgi:protein-S-isoprenylcysteine O-methyltransferase Ste14